ncbi:MAG TPA: pyridoxal-phosphate dependent enzyme, partial [Thermopetrobacter sp.]|nr:pyridoxal-phosphate dependent enzyme [Thermopetrobacter sp.]
ETQSREKKDAIRQLGAILVEVPAAPYRNPNNFVKYSSRLAKELEAVFDGGAFWANQFDNTVNRTAHTETTAEEIWRQTDGRVDAFICAVGSGGTLGGVSDGLKAKTRDIVIGLADPHGAALYSYYTSGELKSEGNSIMEGIGQGRVTKNIDGAAVDVAFRISDAEALEVLYDLNQYEGLNLGGSSGINVAGAMRLAKELGPGKTIVTMLCDSGNRYVSKLGNPAFLKEKGLPLPPWLREEPPHIPQVFEDVPEEDT